MNDAQFQATQEYLEQLQSLILLNDYEIHLKREPAEDGCWATVVVGSERHAAWVKVAWHEFYDELTPEQQRLYLMHELVHVIADGPDRVLRRSQIAGPTMRRLSTQRSTTTRRWSS